MLHNCRNAGATRGHPYPKVMLLYMLVLRYWRSTNFCAAQMMRNNMSLFNEELGELTFSILARSVLADHTRDDFEHMDRLFRLLRVYRDVKSDVVADNSGASNSLNWRHKIQKSSDKITSTQIFFKKIIKQMVNGTYQSYDGSPACYKNAQSGSELRIRTNSPVVYMQLPELDAYLKKLMTVIRADMLTNFLHPDAHIWPECIGLEDMHENHEVVVVEGRIDIPDEVEVDEDVEKERDEKEDVKEVDADADNNDNQQQDDDDKSDHEADADDGVNPFERRTWKAWGRVNEENTMYGKRKTNPVQRFQYENRRVNGRYPDPKM